MFLPERCFSSIIITYTPVPSVPGVPYGRFGQSPGARRRAGEQRSQHLIELVSLLASGVRATAPQAKMFEIVLRLLSSQRYGAFQQSRECAHYAVMWVRIFI